jgi:tetratricopeptide (TPR) repeat protein
LSSERVVAVDCHAHVMRRDLPLAPDRHSGPKHDVTVEEFLGELDGHAISHGILTAPSFYGTDNSLLLSALDAAAGRLRGTAIVAPDIAEEELAAMDRRGIVGIRLNWIRRDTLVDVESAAYRKLFERVRLLAWQVEIYLEGPKLATVLPRIRGQGVKVVVDHFGSPDPARGVACANAYAAETKMDGVLAGVPHAYDFMQYAYLQLGQDAKAKALVDKSLEVKKVIGPVHSGNTARAAVPARYMLERQDWKGAAELPVLKLSFPPADAITHFARAMGAARSGDPAAAQADIDRMVALREGLLKANQGDWAEQVEVQVIAARAWQAQAKGDSEEAFKLMAAAANLEDSTEKHVAMENRLYPMRELFGDMLMLQGQPRAALAAYEQSMRAAPERLRGYYGAAKPAEAIGDKAQANGYFRKLAYLTRNADGARAELQEAKLRLTGQS